MKPDIVLQRKPFAFAFWKASGVIVLDKYYKGPGKNRLQMDRKQLRVMVGLLREAIHELKEEGLL